VSNKDTYLEMASTLCYNRGCGKKFNPRNNPEGSCQYHPGAPKFHEGYKGWTCCEKRTTDFTEFLNIPGCTKGKCSNVKPEEPEHITGKIGEANNIELPTTQDSNVTQKPRESLESMIRLSRPDFEKATLTRIKPTIARSLLDSAKLLETQKATSSQEIPIGKVCENGGCKKTYNGEPSKPNECCYHPGVPIFHEGLKFWSCCQRKTTDFQSFLNQEGCTWGVCKWRKDNEGSSKVECRYDWHQTATHVTIAIYGKKYDPEPSYVELSPVRMKCHIVYPEEGGCFDMDIELRGIISVKESSVSFLGTKQEIKMKKAEPGSWAKLEIPREVAEPEAPKDLPVLEEPKIEELDDDLSDLDLDDLDVAPRKSGLSKEASNGRTEHEII